MLFNSPEFLIFFPIVTLFYFLIPFKFRWVHLLLASCIFYAAFVPSYLLILFLLIFIDYAAGLLIEKGHYRKLWLVVSVLANLSLLGIFKYYDFFVSNVNALIGSQLIVLKWVLPIGLSFHTFQSMSYTIEVYRGNQKAIRHAGYYALYVMFYPQLVAGPIERPQKLLPQLLKKQVFSYQHLYEGLRLMAWGFFKKVVVADRVGQFADAVFSSPAQSGVITIWLAVFFFSIQIYADFSGYSDIAIGAARCTGIDLCVNFNRPYFAANIREFWKRWHMSLSSWFKDYIYIPLGGNRKGFVRKNINLLITFMLSAVWHGAGWTFIVWGVLHGTYTLMYDGFKRLFSGIKINRFITWFITAVAVSFAWIFFRASTLSDAIQLIARGVSPDYFSIKNILLLPNKKIQFGNFTLLISFCMIAYMFIVERLATPKMLNMESKKILDTGIFVTTILLIIFFGLFKKSSFIYFQF
jgi:D-alanyl-lipoteichoic acid acyltransferase DltB (MBOAT superfamily)